MISLNLLRKLRSTRKLSVTVSKYANVVESAFRHLPTYTLTQNINFSSRPNISNNIRCGTKVNSNITSWDIHKFKSFLWCIKTPQDSVFLFDPCNFRLWIPNRFTVKWCIQRFEDCYIDGFDEYFWCIWKYKQEIRSLKEETESTTGQTK